MIKESDLLDAIAECQGERNPNANTCMKLASYYTILNNINRETPTYSQSSGGYDIVYDSGSEFSEAIKGRDINEIMPILDELMETVQALLPRLYNATIRRLSEL